MDIKRRLEALRKKIAQLATPSEQESFNVLLESSTEMFAAVHAAAERGDEEAVRIVVNLSSVLAALEAAEIPEEVRGQGIIAATMSLAVRPGFTHLQSLILRFVALIQEVRIKGETLQAV